jgi:hypothetical protein
VGCYLSIGFSLVDAVNSRILSSGNEWLNSAQTTCVRSAKSYSMNSDFTQIILNLAFEFSSIHKVC